MLIKLEDVVDLPTEPYHPQRIQQLAVECKAQRCYESQSRQLKNEREKFFRASRGRSPLRASTRTLPSPVAIPLKKCFEQLTSYLPVSSDNNYACHEWLNVIGSGRGNPKFSGCVLCASG